MNNIEISLAHQRWNTVSVRLIRNCTIAACSILMMCAFPAAAAPSKGGDTWNDNYTNTVTATGVTTSFPDHEKHIPGEVIASKMKDKESANTVWEGQGGKVTDYQGSVASGKIRIVVDFGYIKDTHEYVREKK